MKTLWSGDVPGLVAELGQTGGADVGSYVEAVHAFAEAGAVAVKVQMIDPEQLAHPSASPYWSTRRYASSQVESFALAGCVPHDGWERVREACDKHDVGFVATPFDLTAISSLVDLAPDAVKIASGDITYRALVEECAANFTQVIFSTGASDGSEVRRAMLWMKVAREQHGTANLLPLACSLEYPCPWYDARLERIAALAEITKTPIGYSDHTVQLHPADFSIVAAAMSAAGAVLVEKHCALEGAAGQVPDLDMAMNPDGARYFVDGLRLGSELRGVDAPFGPRPEENDARVGARRALCIVRPLEAGHVIADGDIVALRPCPADAVTPIDPMPIGHALEKSVEPGYVSSWLRTANSLVLETKTW